MYFFFLFFFFCIVQPDAIYFLLLSDMRTTPVIFTEMENDRDSENHGMPANHIRS